MYQKAYVEFFVSPAKLDSLESRLQKQSSITYMAINSKGKVCNLLCAHPPGKVVIALLLLLAWPLIVKDAV